MCRWKMKKDFFEVQHAPYIKGFSEGLQRKLRKLQIGLVPKKQDTICSNLCKLKQKVEWVECKDVIYSVPCKKCGVRYIKETGQHFCQRAKQHQSDIKNKKTTDGFYAHLTKNEGHTINWDGAVSWIEKGIGEEGRSRKLCSSMLRIRRRKSIKRGLWIWKKVIYSRPNLGRFQWDF